MLGRRIRPCLHRHLHKRLHPAPARPPAPALTPRPRQRLLRPGPHIPYSVVA